MAESNSQKRKNSSSKSFSKNREQFVLLMDREQRNRRLNDQEKFEKLQQRRNSDMAKVKERQIQIKQKEEAFYRKREDVGEFKRTVQSFGDVYSGPKVKAPYEAIKLGNYLRQKMKEGSSSAWEIAYLFAGIIDAIDLIPIAGWIVNLFLKPALFVMLLGYGSWKITLVRFILIVVLDVIPGSNFVPWSIIAVRYSHLQSKKESKKAKEDLEMLEAQLAKN